MPRIGATISGLEQFLLTQLANTDAAVLESAVRLTTGNQYNSPADNPSAFIEIGQFERRLSVIQDTKLNVDRAASIGAQAQLVVEEVRTQLETIRDALVLDVDGTLTTEERVAQQATIDAAIASIDEVADTEIEGKRYLDGSVNYRFAGRDSSEISSIDVYALRETEFSGSVSTAATQAELTYQGAGTAIGADATFTLSGERGSTTISVTSGQTLASAAELINEQSHATGVTAAAVGNNLRFTTVDYGSAATIDISVSSGSFNTTGATPGTDAVATINGQVVDAALVDGNQVRYTSNGTHVFFEFAAGFTGNFNAVTVSDADVSHFRLSPDLQEVTRFGLAGISAALLGGVSGRVNELASGESLAGLADNTSQAIRVIDEALAALTRREATVDAFADVTVAAASSLLDELGGEVEATLTDIRSVKEEQESLLLTKNQSLGANAISSISILQQQQANVLSLVRAVTGI